MNIKDYSNTFSAIFSWVHRVLQAKDRAGTLYMALTLVKGTYIPFSEICICCPDTKFTEQRELQIKDGVLSYDVPAEQLKEFSMCKISVCLRRLIKKGII